MLQFVQSPNKLWVSSKYGLGGDCRGGTDLHGEIRLLILILTRAEVRFSILVIRSCCGLGMLPGGMLPGVLG